MADEIYTAGLVGLGRIGWRFDEDPKEVFIHTHAGAYTHHPRFRLIGAADVSPETCSAFGQRYPGVATHASLTALLDDQVPDCLSIATHADSHLDLVRAGVDAGVRAIWCEKPLAPTGSAGREIIRICDEAGVVLAVNHWRRWDGTHRNIEQWLKRGEIGHIRQVVCYYGAGIWNTGPHLFDLLEQWFGPISWLQSSQPLCANAADPDMDIMGGFAEGGRWACRALPVKQEYLMFSFDIFGSEGRLEVTTNAESVRISRSGPCLTSSEYQVLQETAEQIDSEPRDYMIFAADDLADCLDAPKTPACGGENGLRAVECVLAAIRSAETKKPAALAAKATIASP